MSNFSPQERQRLISMYITQYNQTNSHITRLFDTLDDIRQNINNLIGNNMNRANQPNRTMQPNNRNNRHHNANTNANSNTNYNYNSRRGPLIHYDYTNPIERSTYIADFMSDVITNNNENMHQHDNNPHILDFLTTFLSSAVPIRPTQQQIDNASRLIRFSDIHSPNSTTCAISLEPFMPSDSVRQLHHCSHIFFPDQFNQWFQNNVRCPVCRHDIRSTTVSSPNNPDLVSDIVNEIPAASVDMSNNTILDSVLSPENRFIYETIIRYNNNNSS
jgi:hypothetical protein